MTPDICNALVDGTASFSHADAHNTRLLTDGAGAVVNRREYDPFGAIRSPDSDDLKSDFGFAGEQRDRESSLVNLRARYYDPSIGRFLARDPLHGTQTTSGFPQTLNRFAYAVNNPVQFVDPSGYDHCDTDSQGQVRVCHPDPSEDPGYADVGDACEDLALDDCQETEAGIPATPAVCAVLYLGACANPGRADATSESGWVSATRDESLKDEQWRPDEPCRYSVQGFEPGGRVVDVRCTAGISVVNVEIIVLVNVGGRPQLVVLSGTAPMVGQPGGDDEDDGTGYRPRGRDRRPDVMKSKEAKGEEVDVWEEATKGLRNKDKTRLHEKLKEVKGGARNADPSDILAERDRMFPNNPYPGGWLDSYR